MKFLRRLISSKKNKEEIHLEWNKHLKKISDSLLNDNLEYPIILLCHVPWDFQVFNNPTELIGESIGGHWGLNDYFSKEADELEIVIDSSGKTYKLSHEHYHKETKTGFSYPSKLEGVETLDNLKKKIIEGSSSFFSDIFPEREEEIRDKQNDICDLTSIKEVITYVGNYMKF
ncbi:hypothetical protein [uncultured Aquimarina sp.]|uniref:hypothetical protein n=1 Tax=uncultured Aquimarina sp. TaxID=575652 RepID=UPI002636B457|nr:hypothetical protein [uncultured Aquimarina sp.]